MADILLDEQSSPATPSAGQGVLFYDSSSSTFMQKNDAGVDQGDASRAKSAAQTLGTGDTYVTDSGLIIPSRSLQVGTFWEWVLDVTKTAAGVAVPAFNIRIGALQTTGDALRLAITTVAQTAVVDSGIIRIICTCRSVGVAGVIRGMVHLQHNLAATGLANAGPAGFTFAGNTSAGFDNTALGGQFIGLSINAGAASAWTIEQCIGRIWYG